MNANRLRSQCLTDPQTSFLALCRLGEAVIGHAFGTIWEYEAGKSVFWITQLVVSSDHRKKVIATSLLNILELPAQCDAIGLVSSHPAAVMALAKRANVRVHKMDLDFIKKTAPWVLQTTPISYLHNAKLRGTLFEAEHAEGMVCSVFTDFPVDHAEPLAALNAWEGDMERTWPLGKLGDGHEFLCIVPIQ